MKRLRAAAQSDINTEFKSQQGIEWKWFLIALVTFAIMDFLAGRG
jgi:hypothetical protein